MVDILLFEIRQKVSKSTADISVYVRTVQFDPQLSHNYSETMSASLLIYLLRPLGGRSPVYPFTSMMKSPACQTLLKHFSVRLASDVWMVCEKRRFTTNGSHLRCLNKAHHTAPFRQLTNASELQYASQTPAELCYPWRSTTNSRHCMLSESGQL